MLVIIVILFAISYFRSPDKNTASRQPSSFFASGFPSLPFSQSGNTLTVKDAKNQEEIKNVFTSFAGNINEKENFREAQIIDASGKSIALKDFLEATGSSLDPKLERLISREKYGIFSCSIPGEVKDFGIILNVGRFSPEENIKYEAVPADLEMSVRKWGATILKDLHNILFPGINFSNEQLDQEIVFKKGKYLFGDVELPGGNRKFVNYANIGDPTIITTSLECMDIAIEEIANEILDR